MTLKNRHLYLGVIVTAIAMVGLSGITEIDAEPYPKNTKKYKTCELNDWGLPKTVKPSMILWSNFWDQGDVDYPHFQIGYIFPETISGKSWDLMRCEVVQEIKKIEISVVTTDDPKNGNEYTCYNREYLNKARGYTDPPVDANNPLTATEDGFPRTEIWKGFPDLQCNHKVVPYSGADVIHNIGDWVVVNVRATYDNLDTGKEKKYTLTTMFEITK